jgi:hypothetical protein
MIKEEIISINKTNNGNMFSYDGSQMIHIEFKNIFLSFHKEDFKNFKKFINDLDVEYIEKSNVIIHNKRKIIIQLKNSKIKICFNRLEFEEFKELINCKRKLSNDVNTFEKFYIDFELFYDN